MQTEITSVKENPLLNRKELTVSVTHEQKGTPSQKVITSVLSNLFKTKESNIIVKNIVTRFGSHSSKCNVRVYDDPEVMEKLESKRKKGLSRRARKTERKQKAKMFGTLRRHVKKQEKRQNK
ncbi:40S ribosomal S24 [Tubulinosema ratisbonensis]|uniref:40S ribosomal S24 n=1 Tax=Tubulinosema ratisbonensis TaxID=291195 RepID=A0A437AM06_9MICR|nr:40S ribosomal S24 [Tubulinosema ratisbonensis]